MMPKISGGPMGDRGRGGPGARGRGGPPHQSPARGGFEGGRGRGGAASTPSRGSTPRGGTPRGRGGAGRGGFGNDSFGSGNGNMGDDDLMYQLMEEAEAEKAKEPKKFLGRCRLFVGNLPNDMEESDFKELFKVRILSLVSIPFGCVYTSYLYVILTDAAHFHNTHVLEYCVMRIVRYCE